MIGSFLTRALALVLGYAYPAYECFKTVELNRPEIEQLRFWCQYWILVAALTVFERAGDTFISWCGCQCIVKQRWHFLYTCGIPKPRHETEIDRNLLELKARAGDMVFLYWQKAAMYGQTRIFQIFQFISFQPTQQQGRSRPTVQRHSVHLGHQTVPSVSAGNQVAPSQKPLQPPRASPSPTKNKNHEPPAKASGVPPPVPTPQIQLSPGTPYQPFASANTSQTSTSEGELKQIATTAAEPASVEDSNLPAKETPIEEAIRMTRGRLRKRAGSFGPSSCQ
ncbi:HVA22-like protein i isoform X3 [Phalaenopsis equestris]|uniref:HVA22-like protein i isoform X3 n=1 Tax=Phalaenopsis equestris TaxID=78828 RepID=UPI0009E18F63|nr:HVA22-like protein i isoform X3 [Phalaenopsis equestris]